MGKMLAMSVPGSEIIVRSSVAPARELGRAEARGAHQCAEADVAVFALNDTDVASH